MKIGADEIILWLRKNNIATTIANDKLGKTIRKIIENNGGSFIRPSLASQWGNDKNVDKFKLPKTSAQYEIDFSKLPDLYEQLKEIK